MSVVADIAEALKETLNGAPGGTFSQEFKAKRVYVPAVKLTDIGTALSVLVVPKTDDRTPLDRGTRTLREVKADIGVQKRLAAGADPFVEAANDEIDGLAALVEEIADFLSAGTQVGPGTIVGTVVNPIYAPEHLAAHSVFTSVITVTLKLVS